MRKNLAITVFLAAILGLAGCGGSTNGSKSADSSSLVVPAPDNNSATNPSLADTAYEKNRTRPVTDTSKKK